MGFRLGDILIEKQLLTPAQLETAIQEHREKNEMLGQTLLRMDLIEEKQLLLILSQQQGLAFIELKKISIDDKVIEGVPAKFAWHYKIMPVKLENSVLTVALSNPFDMWPIDDLETNLGYRVETVLATSNDIMESIRKYYGVGADTIDRILAEETKAEPEEDLEPQEEVQDLEKMAEDASVIKLVNQILHQAIQERATDIHIENFREEVILRYRVDGVLRSPQVAGNIKFLYPAIISRVKVMSNLDIIERRLPQDGRAKIKIGKNEYDLRVSIIPTLNGENIVIRVLPTTMLFNVLDLGMTIQDVETLESLIKNPHGIIFVTGPTGSGKSTTLYTCLSRLNKPEKKIITIEDPVEYEIKGISQIQIHPDIKLTFSSALRSVLRHDPDVIMVGEVRDFETAEITIKTALTGHLVFSSLHTNNAAGGVTRLIDMGIDPFLITSAVEAFIAQRLVRTICDQCKVEDEEMHSEFKEKLEAEYKLSEKKIPRELKTYKGKGCEACNFTGYLGRTGIYELLLVNSEIRKLILTSPSSDLIEKKARLQGMRTLRQDGFEKILMGITTPEEVFRVTQNDL